MPSIILDPTPGEARTEATPPSREELLLASIHLLHREPNSVPLEGIAATPSARLLSKAKGRSSSRPD